MTSDPLHIVWFKRDLRVQDHEALVRASACGPVLPLYIVEPGLWREPDAAGRHWSFARDCLEELQAVLGAQGQPLIIRIGDTVDVLQQFQRTHAIAGLWSHQETGNGWTYARDQRVLAWTKAQGIPWTELRQSGTIRRLKNRNGWAKAWDGFMAKPVVETPVLRPLSDLEPTRLPTAKDLGLAADPCPERQTGGRTAALATLTSFLTVRGEPYRKAMSTPDLGAIHCSRISPHLAWGTVSMREVTQTLWARQRELKHSAEPTGGWRGALTSFSGRLHWRDHFIQKLEDEPRLEFENLHPAYDGMRPEVPDRQKLDAWAKGETGLPFVDACMRCLKATGWMNFRMRAMLTATASYHLWLPWRASGEHLARMFTDYEPGIHWPQVQMQSGTTGINTIRIYNPVKQGHDQDPSGRFTRTWVPELSDVPDQYLQEPWKWDEAATVLGKNYPSPIVDPVEAAREAKARVYAVRRGPTFRDQAGAIQDKHGSRKSGMPITGRRRSRQQANKDQFELDL